MTPVGAPATAFRETASSRLLASRMFRTRPVGLTAALCHSVALPFFHRHGRPDRLLADAAHYPARGEATPQQPGTCPGCGTAAA